ncbi:hypothetical protein BOSP111201_26895 [Bordetella sputigena]
MRPRASLSSNASSTWAGSAGPLSPRSRPTSSRLADPLWMDTLRKSKRAVSLSLPVHAASAEPALRSVPRPWVACMRNTPASLPTAKRASWDVVTATSLRDTCARTTSTAGELRPAMAMKPSARWTLVGTGQRAASSRRAASPRTRRPKLSGPVAAMPTFLPSTRAVAPTDIATAPVSRREMPTPLSSSRRRPCMETPVFRGACPRMRTSGLCALAWLVYPMLHSVALPVGCSGRPRRTTGTAAWTPVLSGPCNVIVPRCSASSPSKEGAAPAAAPFMPVMPAMPFMPCTACARAPPVARSASAMTSRVPAP